MIITCEQCETQFQLDDSRIPERGARVRCSRCKHAFFVKPAGGAGDPVEHAVEQALAEDEVERSGSTQELGPAAALRAEAGEESDWEFDDGGRDTEPDLAAAREAVDDLLAPADEAPSGQAEHGLLGADSGVDDDIDSLLESNDYSAELGETGPAGPVMEEPAIASVEPEPAAPPVPEEAADPPPLKSEARAPEEDLGSPENWEFFAGEKEAWPSREADLERTPIGQIPLGPVPKLERPPIDVNVEPSKIGQRLRQLAHAAGWLSVALLVLGGLHGGIVAQRAGPVALRTAQTAAGFEASAVKGRWLDNAAVGPIFVISGKLLRVGSYPAVPGSWLAVRLFDENGVMLAEQAAVAGPALPEQRLREENPRELRAVQAQGALAIAGAPLVPGDTWAFQAILTDLPEAASRFDLAAIPVEAPPAQPEPHESPGEG